MQQELISQKYMLEQQPEVSETPEATSPQTQEAPLVRPVAGKGFRRIALGCSILGGLGLLRVLFALPALLFSPQTVDASQFRGPQGAEFRAVAEKTMEVAETFFLANVGIQVAHLAIAAALLYGGLMLRPASKKSHSFLMWVCAGAIGFEVMRFLLYGLQSYQLTTAVSGAFTGQAAAAFKGGMIVGVVFSLACSLVYVLAKCVFYYFSLDYLQKSSMADKVPA